MTIEMGQATNSSQSRSRTVRMGLSATLRGERKHKLLADQSVEDEREDIYVRFLMMGAVPRM